MLACPPTAVNALAVKGLGFAADEGKMPAGCPLTPAKAKSFAGPAITKGNRDLQHAANHAFEVLAFQAGRLEGVVGCG